MPSEQDLVIETGGQVTINLHAPFLPGRTLRISNQEVGRVLSVGTPAPGHLTRESFAQALASLEQQPIRTERRSFSREDWADIVQWSEDLVREPEEYARDFTSEPQAVLLAQVALETGHPRGVFSAFDWDHPPGSSPDTNSVIFRYQFQFEDPDPVVSRFLEALVRQKILSSTPVSERVPGVPKTVWEALLELDLVDAEQAGP